MKQNGYKALFFIAVVVIFFYKTFLHGMIPFPADGLVSDFQPWRSESYLGYQPGGIPNKAQYPDTYRQLYPWKTAVVNAYRQFRFPLWNPYNFSGTPLLANFQSQALYPLNIFYFFLPQPIAWTILIILQPLLSLFLMYLYMEKITHNIYARILASISFAFSGFLSVWLEYNTIGHIVMMTPVFFLCIEHMREKPAKRWIALTALSVYMIITAGHPQVAFYTIAAALLYAAYRLPRGAAFQFFGSLLLGVGISSIQLLPGLELISQAARSAHDPNDLLTKILIQPWQLFSLVFPNIFGNPATRTYWPEDTFIGKVTTIGLVPLFFLPSAIRDKQQVSRWFLAAILITLLLITNTPVAALLYRIPIPVLQSSSPTLLGGLFAFFLSVFCGIGFDYWIRDSHSLKKLGLRSLQVAVLFGVLLLLTKIPVFPQLFQHAVTAQKAILYGSAIAAATLFGFYLFIRVPSKRQIALSLFLFIAIADLWVFFTRFNPFVDQAIIFPKNDILSILSSEAPKRIWGYGTASIASNFATQYQFFSPEGYDPLYPKRYGELLYAYKNNHIQTTFTDHTRSDAAVSAGFGSDGLSDTAILRILDITSTTHILDRTENGSTENTFPESRYIRLAERKDWRIYTNTLAAPRAFFATAIKPYENAEDFSRQLFSQSFRPATDILVPEAFASLPVSSTSATATILSYQPEQIIINTDSPTDATLVLTDTYYPGWKATVDGKPVQIIPVNWTFRAIRVPQGVHRVDMTYAPKSFVFGIIFTMISSMILCGVLMMKRR